MHQLCAPELCAPELCAPASNFSIASIRFCTIFRFFVNRSRVFSLVAASSRAASCASFNWPCRSSIRLFRSSRWRSTISGRPTDNADSSMREVPVRVAAKVSRNQLSRLVFPVRIAL